jgi:hypothetical protein
MLLPWQWRQQKLQQWLCSYFIPFNINLLKTVSFSHHSICSILSKIMSLCFMIFCIDLLLFYITNITNFIFLTRSVFVLNSVSIKLKYQWSYWTGSKGFVSVCILWTVCAYVKCLSYTSQGFCTGFLLWHQQINILKGIWTVMSKWVCIQSCQIFVVSAEKSVHKVIFIAESFYPHRWNSKR